MATVLNTLCNKGITLKFKSLSAVAFPLDDTAIMEEAHVGERCTQQIASSESVQVAWQ
jgi:hypothetical protein